MHENNFIEILKRTGGCLAINNNPTIKVSELIACSFRNGLGLYGQVTKRTRRMPWHVEAMKDVVACDKLR